MPDLPILLYTQPEDVEGLDVSAFNEIHEVEGACHSFSDKFEAWQKSPFERTLAVDTDTFFFHGCDNLFEILDKYDMAMAYEVFLTEYKFETVPISFPTLNTGVILFKKNDITAGVFQRTVELHEEIYSKHVANDQPAMRHALWESEAKLFILRQEYNLRIHYGATIGGAATPFILHDHNPNPAKYEKILSKNSGLPRYYGPIRPSLIAHWYFHKALKALRNRFSRLRQ